MGLFGVTTLDVVRAETFVAAITGAKDPSKCKIPVIGGHSGETIVPLFSQSEPKADIPEDKLDDLTYRVQFGGDEVVQAKDGAGSATLSMAFAGARFTYSVIKALNGETGITECTFVENDLTDAPFFSTPVTLGRDGVETVHGFGTLSAMEQENFDAMIPDLVS